MKELIFNWEIFWCFSWTQCRVRGKMPHQAPCHLKLNNAEISTPVQRCCGQALCPLVPGKSLFSVCWFWGAVQTRRTRCQKINTQSEAQFINQKLNAAARKARLAQALLGTIWLKSTSPQVWCPAAAARAGTSTAHVPWQALPVPRGRGSSWICISSSSKNGESPPSSKLCLIVRVCNSSGVSGVW